MFWLHRTVVDSQTLFREKEREQRELEDQSSTASKALQTAQSNLSNLKAQLKTKRDEIKSAYGRERSYALQNVLMSLIGLDKKIEEGLNGDHSSVDDALGDATREVGMRNEFVYKVYNDRDY